MNIPYNPIDVANYIVWRANNMKQPVTHLKLQKLLYYVVATYLQTHKSHLIDETIVKWQYGPVVKSVYHQFKILGSLKITEPSEYILNKDPKDLFAVKWADVNQIVQDLDNISTFKKVVDRVLDDLLPLSAFQLVDITHAEPAWRDCEHDILNGRELIYSDNDLMVATYAR